MWGSEWTIFWVYLISGVLGHHYKPHEVVPVWADRGGLYDFPAETYSFASLPLCELWNETNTPDNSAVIKRPLSFGELLEGKRAYRSPHVRITWPEDLANPKTPESNTLEVKEICRMKLTRDLVTSLNNLIRQKVWVSYDIGGIPIYGLIGNLSSTDNTNTTSSIPRLYSHKTFVIERNKDQIVGAALNMSSPVELRPNKVLRLTYAVNFVDSNKSFTDRLQPSFMDDLKHPRDPTPMICTVVSLAVGIFLTGSVFVISHNMSNKITSTDQPDDIEASPNSVSRFGEPGYRAIAREVFKEPKYITAHSVIIGSGAQIATALLCAAICSCIFSHKGLTLVPTKCLLYAYTLCQPINGGIGAMDFLTNLRTSKTAVMGLKVAAFWQFVTVPLILVAIFIQLNTVNAIYGSSKAMEFLPLLYQLISFIVINGTLHTVGTYLAYTYCRDSKPIVPPNTLERPVFKPAKTLRRKIILLVALIPFAAVSIQTFIIYNKYWQGWSPISSDYLLITGVIYIALVGLASLIGLCILLQAEDHKWHWFPIKCGIVTTLCFICQTLVQYMLSSSKGAKLPSSAYLQRLNYWATTLYISLGIFFCSSSIGYLCCNQYIRRLYSTKI